METAEALPSPARPPGDRRLLVRIGLLVLVATILLEVWRPWFYLEDDNFTSYMPGIVEFSRKLWTGQNPFRNEHIFGGEHNLLADPSVFGVLSPWLPLVSWLALTPAYLWITECMSLCNSLAIALAFGWSAIWLRRHGHHQAPDWLIALLSVSYTFTPYNLLLGSSWVGFLNGQASFPLLVVGFLHPGHRRAVLLMTGALLYALFGGHAHTFIIVCLFGGGLALLVSVQRRTFAPAGRLIAAGLLAAVFILPLLLPTLEGFQASPRGTGLSARAASNSAIPFFSLASSFLFGPISSGWMEGIPMHGADPVFNLAVAFSIASVPAVVALVSAALSRQLHPLALPLLGCFAVACLFVVRPEWLGELITRIPLLRSLQWPFREVWLLLFVAHALVLLHFQHLQKVPGLVAAGISALGLGLVFANEPPALYPFHLDRSLVFSGEAERYWTRVRQKVGGTPKVILSVHPKFVRFGRPKVPFSLLGGYTFGSLYGYVSESGYTFTASLRPGQAARPSPYFFAGCYVPPDAQALAKEIPEAWLVELAGLDPARWIVSRGEQKFRFLLDPQTGSFVELPDLPARP